MSLNLNHIYLSKLLKTYTKISSWIYRIRNRNLIINFVIILLSFIAFGSISVYMGQANNFDLRNYHFYNPYAILNDRLGFDYAPAQIQTYLNPTMDLMFYFFVKNLPPKIVGFLMGGIHGLNFWIIFAIAFYTLKSIKRPKNGNSISGSEFKADNWLVGFSLIISTIGIYGPISINGLGLTDNDNLVSLFTLGAILLLLKAISTRGVYSLSDMKKELIVSGILVGIAIGLKLTQAVYGIGFIVALTVFKGDWRSRINSVALVMVAIAGGIILSSGYWMFQMWVNFESPLFPFYNEIFRSPYYTFTNFADTRYILEGFIENLIYPFYFFFQSIFFDVHYPGMDIRFAIIYVLLLVLIYLFMRNKFLRSTYRVTRGNIILMARISMFLLILFVFLYPLWQTMLILGRRLILLDLSTYVPFTNYIAYLISVLLMVLTFFIVKNIELKTRTFSESGSTELTKRVSFFLLTFFTVSYIVWQLKFSHSPRYILPLEVLSPLMIVVLLTYIVRDVTLRHWYIVVLFVMIAVTVLVPQRRISWGDPFFRVKVPKVEQLDESIIIMAGKDALAYLIPFFPAGTRFVRLESYFKFTNPGVDTKFQKEIKELIKNHKGPFYLLSRLGYILEHERVVEAYNLKIYRDESYAIFSEHEPKGLRLWRVQKIN